MHELLQWVADNPLLVIILGSIGVGVFYIVRGLRRGPGGE